MSDWTTFLNDIEQARKELRCDRNGAWYRGVRKNSYRLYPKLLRPNAGLGMQQERDIFHEYCDHSGKDVNGKSSWDLLAELQHHGSPTRLLDWTEVFGVALFFALGTEKDASKSPAIWIINPFTIAGRARKLAYPNNSYDKEIAVFHREKDFDYYERILRNKNWPFQHPMPYRPAKLIPRIRAQRGFFTVHGNDIRSIDGIFQKKAVQIPIPKNARTEARKFLELSGINTLSMFPDREGYSSYVDQKYRN